MLETDRSKTEQRAAKMHREGHVQLSRAEILRDYGLAVQSRAASLIGRREVLSGKAKFRIFGGGKEVAQIAMAKTFRKGDWRSGYYRDQTLMFALGLSNIQEFFAQLYAHTDVGADPHSAGRQMNSHYATRLLDADGSWRDQTESYNSSADLSPTGAQMPRLVGLGYASRLYRELEELQGLTQFSREGSEIAFGTIGNASCAEGLFWEAINAIGVLRSPVVIAIWDDDYGISVPNEFQITKRNLSELLKGFQREPGSTEGYDLYTVKGWDYISLIETFAKAADVARSEHIPAIVHVVDLTQPQGHSTSGSHERYKSKERLQWEKEYDCNRKFREWIVEQRIAEPGELDQLERNASKIAENMRLKAWKAFSLPIFRERQEVAELIAQMEHGSTVALELSEVRQTLMGKATPFRKDILAAVHQALLLAKNEPGEARKRLISWREEQVTLNEQRIGSHLYSQSENSTLRVNEIRPIYADETQSVPGYQVLNAAFEAMIARDARVIAFGEDVGMLGGVNQTWAGLQEKFGPLRVTDTGIREATILGQAIGMAMRGLRPIAEVQYLDYLLYALQTMSDDLATLHWRTAGGQKAPVIVSTRGHRLEGVWHAGSPMSSIINLVRGMHVLVPRDMTRAPGFYNTLLLGDEPGLVVEVLNGYRLKEKMPDNIGDITVPLGIPEVLKPGEDATIVTYGAACRIAMKSAEMLQQLNIDVEVIDVQSLLPFDRHRRILDSLKKTSRIVFMDEDVPGGATAYMMQQVIEKQGGFYWLDSEPRTVTAKAHRPAFGSDGGYFSKPNADDLFDAVYELMNEANPARYPLFYTL